MGFDIDYAQLLVGMAKVMPAFSWLLNAIAFLAGFSIIALAVTRLAKQQDDMAYSERGGKFSRFFVTILAGTLLVNFNATVGMFMNATTGQSEMAYVSPDAVADYEQKLFIAVISLVQFVGLAGVFNGLVQLYHLGNGHGQPGQLGKAAVFIIFGSAAFNIVGVIVIVKNTIGAT